jgi:hypothetical protein
MVDIRLSIVKHLPAQFSNDEFRPKHSLTGSGRVVAKRNPGPDGLGVPEADLWPAGLSVQLRLARNSEGNAQTCSVEFGFSG